MLTFCSQRIRLVLTVNLLKCDYFLKRGFYSIHYDSNDQKYIAPNNNDIGENVIDLTIILVRLMCLYLSKYRKKYQQKKRPRAT